MLASTRPRHLWTAFAVALFLLGAAPSAPTFGDVALDYESVPGCPGEAIFRERAADVYRFHDPFVPQGEPASSRIHIEISKQGRRHRGVLRVLDAGGGVLGSTTEVHESCDALVWVLSRRIAMVIEPPPPPSTAPPPSTSDIPIHEELGRRLDRLEEAAEAQDEAMKAQQRRIALLEKALEDRRRKMNLTYTLSAGALMTANLTADVGPGVWIGGDVRLEPASIGLELRSVLPSRIEIGPYDNDLSQFVALLTACGRYWIFFGCTPIGGGVQVNHDSNFDTKEPTGYYELYQVGVRLGVEVPLGESPLAVRSWAEMLISQPTAGYIYSAGSKTYYAERPDVGWFFGLGLVVKVGAEGAK